MGSRGGIDPTTSSSLSLRACSSADYVRRSTSVRILGDGATGHSSAREIVKFALTQEKLDGPEIPGAPIDQRRFRTPQRMRAVGSRIRSNRRHPTPADSGILARRKMRRLRNAARKYELIRLEMSGRYPSARRVPRLLGPFRIAPAAEFSSA